MKTTVRALLMLTLATSAAQAQDIQFTRPNDKAGINLFEPTKEETGKFEGVKVKIGGSFAQDFQTIKHSNTPDTAKANQLIPLTNGFNLAMANLTLDAQLDDGIRGNVTMYLSSRHHSEAWVKGGYIQIDKLPFFKSEALDELMKNFTIKIGHFDVDYGDMHYRRTDGGNVMHNPFVENYIMDGFATEIGGEIYYHPVNTGIIAMVGVTNGMLNPTVVEATAFDSVTKEKNVYSPAIHAKLGYDKQLNDDLRVRLTGSLYTLPSTSRNTLYAGDRTGSHYFLAMENTAATASAQFTSGRFSPNFTDEVTAIMINPFIKFQGLEFFGTYEMASGRMINEIDNRDATQLAGELIYRFGPTENFWVGGRYNKVDATLNGKVERDVTIDRITGSLGWFITPNIMMKTEYVTQNYDGFAPNDIRNEGKFDGLVIEAGLGF
jgi:hypothetical protein